MIGDGDLEAIFENGDFDVEAVFTISTGVTLTVKGWFTAATQQTNPVTLEVEAVNPMFDCSSDALETTGHVVKNRMSVTIDGGTYTVERVQKNGNGVTTVHLKS